jgi:hypothetical protein
LAAVQAIQLDFEGHAEVKRYRSREVCWFCEAARPEDALVARVSGRLIHACHSCARFLLGTNLVFH